MHALPTLALGGLLLTAAAAAAQSRPPVPPVVMTHMNDLDARCRAAGGRPAQGRHVFAQDFTGDGRLDYLVSEGDYQCAGRPGLFRPGGQARVDIYVADARGQVLRAYTETLIAYRLLAGRPVKVQVARRGAACGAGASPATQCAAQLAWNGRAFGEGASTSRAPQASPPVGAAGTEAQFLARCRTDYLRKDASAARWADGQCREDWKKVVAAGPAADALLAILPTPGQRPAPAQVRQRLAGPLGGLTPQVEGGASPTAVGVGWRRTGELIPYDLVGALRVRGATLDLASCEKLGTGEGTRTYAGAVPGRAPFALTVDERTAPTANADSYYGARMSLDGRQPSRGPMADCDF